MTSLSPTWLVTGALRSRPAASLLDSGVALRVGLAVLFLVNALVAWVDPGQFRSLVAASGADRLVSADLVIWSIRANDLAIGLLVLFSRGRTHKLACAWAGLYLLGVCTIKLAAL